MQLTATRRLLPSALAFMALALGLAPGSTPVSAQDRAVSTEKPDPLKWFACKVEVEVEKTSYKTVRGVGSGTPVATEDGKTLVVTNAHVIPSEHRDKPITVYVNGKAYPAKAADGAATRSAPGFIDIDGPDLCFLQVDADLGAVPLRATAVKDGEAVYYCGFGGHTANVNPPARTGKVSTAEQTGDKHLVFSGSPVKGDSGAGVFDADGKMVGVVWGGDTRTYAVPLKSVQRFVERPLLTKLFPRAAKRLAELKGVQEIRETAPADKKTDAPGVSKPTPGPGPTTVPPPAKK